MTHFCQNPECTYHNLQTEAETVRMWDDRIIKKEQYIHHTVEKGYEIFYFCSVCIGVLDLLKISI